MSPSPATAALVLAGGRSRRMGQDKAVQVVAGRRLVDRALDLVRPCCDEQVIVRGDPARPPIPGLDAHQIADEIPGQGALGGIHAGLRAIEAPAAVVIACDMPLLESDFLIWLVRQLGDHDVVVPRSASGLQPLCAVYRPSCLPAIESALARGRRQVFAFYPDVRTREIDMATADRFRDREELFTNVNTPADLIRVERRLVPEAAG